MNTEIKPRKHADMAVQYMTDDSLKCWLWDGDEWALAAIPTWYAETIYHVGHESPTAPPKRKITIAGITFDEPETDELALGAEYWLFKFCTPSASLQRWNDDPYDHRWLANGLIHLDEENANLHAQALRKLNQELIEQQRGAA